MNLAELRQALKNGLEHPELYPNRPDKFKRIGPGSDPNLIREFQAGMRFGLGLYQHSAIPILTEWFKEPGDKSGVEDHLATLFWVTVRNIQQYPCREGHEACALLRELQMPSELITPAADQTNYMLRVLAHHATRGTQQAVDRFLNEILSGGLIQREPQ